LAGASHGPIESEDQADIRKLRKEYSSAFAAVSASVYAADGDLGGVDGALATGPAAIRKLYGQLFAAFQTASIRDAEISPARGTARDVAIVNGN
jgi:hypothetical protein